MIRAYVAPTDAPTIWVDVPGSRATKDGGTVCIELTPTEAEDLREELHHAARTTELECETPGCKGHQVGRGYCVRCGGAS